MTLTIKKSRGEAGSEIGERHTWCENSVCEGLKRDFRLVAKRRFRRRGSTILRQKATKLKRRGHEEEREVAGSRGVLRGKG